MGKEEKPLSRLGPNAPGELSVAYMLAHANDTESPGYAWRFDRDRIAEMVDPGVGDLFGLAAAFEAEVSYHADEAAGRAERQAVAGKYEAAAGSLAARGRTIHAAQAMVASATFDTEGRVEALADAAADLVLGTKLPEENPTLVGWVGHSLGRIAGKIADAKREQLVAHFLQGLKAAPKEIGPIDHYAKAALAVAPSQPQRESVYQARVDALLAAADQAERAIIKDFLLEEAAAVATEKLHDHEKAREILAVRSKLDIISEMAQFETKIDLAQYINARREFYGKLLREHPPAKSRENLLGVLLVGFSVEPIFPMPAPDEKREPGIGDLLAQTVYSQPDRTVKRPKSPPMQQVRIERSLANQVFHAEASDALRVLRSGFLGPFLDYLMELESDAEAPKWGAQLRPVVKAYLEGEWFPCAAMGCIVTETLGRDCWSIVGKHPQFYRDESTHTSVLTSVLSDSAVDDVLGPQLARQLRYLYGDDDGLNRRNHLLHGNLHPRQVGEMAAAAVLYSVLGMLARIGRRAGMSRAGAEE